MDNKEQHDIVDLRNTETTFSEPVPNGKPEAPLPVSSPHKSRLPMVLLLLFLFASLAFNVLFVGSFLFLNIVSSSAATSAEYSEELWAYDYDYNYDYEYDYAYPALEFNFQGDMDDLSWLVSYLSTDAISEIAINIARSDEMDIGNLMVLAPYMSSDAIEEVMMILAENGSAGLEDVSYLAPYISSDYLDRIVLHLMNEEEYALSDLKGIIPYLRTETVDELARRSVSGNN